MDYLDYDNDNDNDNDRDRDRDGSDIEILWRLARAGGRLARAPRDRRLLIRPRLYLLDGLAAVRLSGLCASSVCRWRESQLDSQTGAGVFEPELGLVQLRDGLDEAES